MTYESSLRKPDHVNLEGVVSVHLTEIFQRHGAIAMEPPLLLPATQPSGGDPHTMFLLDRQGDLLHLPKNALLPFARSAAQTNIRRIKRYHVGNVYQAM